MPVMFKYVRTTVLAIKTKVNAIRRDINAPVIQVSKASFFLILFIFDLVIHEK